MKPTPEDNQLAKAIYLKNMTAMKEILNLGEFKIGGRESEDYKYFKKVVMDQFYNTMGDTFRDLEKKGLLIKCNCGTTIRQGYKTCTFCNGASFRNSDLLDDMISEYKIQIKPQE